MNRRRPSRWVALVACACLLRALLPVGGPPVRTVAADAGWFCAGHRCGCRSAEECRRSCCCSDSAPSSRRTADTGEKFPILSALRCQGGGDPSTTSSGLSWTGVPPRSTELELDRVPAVPSSPPSVPPRGSRPEPPTPPPRPTLVAA